MKELIKSNKYDAIFNELKTQKGHQMLIFFPNGFGVSVVRHSFSYGNELGLFELAVLKGNKDKWALTYDTYITDDVLGWLTVKEVWENVELVSKL